MTTHIKVPANSSLPKTPIQGAVRDQDWLRMSLRGKVDKDVAKEIERLIETLPYEMNFIGGLETMVAETGSGPFLAKTSVETLEIGCYRRKSGSREWEFVILEVTGIQDSSSVFVSVRV